MHDLSQPEAIWRSRAAAISRKVNVAWWIQSFNLPFTVMAIAVACFILFARYKSNLPSYTTAMIFIFIVIVALGLFCWLRIKKQFESKEESLVRMEELLGMKNSLSAAHAGIVPWPAISNADVQPAKKIPWNLPRTLFPSLVALLIIVSSFFLPIGTHAKTEAPLLPPTALTDLQAKLELLVDEDIIQEDYIEELQEQITGIAMQDPSDWFSHSSLEAIDSLTFSHDSAAKELANNLSEGERALQSLQKHGEKLSQETQSSLLNEFSKAVEGIDSSRMKPNKELLDALKQLDPSQLKQLNQEQLDQLRQNMRRMAKKLKQQQRESGQ